MAATSNMLTILMTCGIVYIVTLCVYVCVCVCVAYMRCENGAARGVSDKGTYLFS